MDRINQALRFVTNVRQRCQQSRPSVCVSWSSLYHDLADTFLIACHLVDCAIGYHHCQRVFLLFGAIPIQD